ncbi:MAG: EthD family reductase [Ginsengibacter sp.]
MIKVSVFYSNEEGKTFDINYYCNKHMPIVRQFLSGSCINAAVEQGIAGGTPGSKATYIAMGHFYFDAVDDFISSFTPHANTIMGDIPNFTNITPVIQISEVKF